MSRTAQKLKPQQNRGRMIVYAAITLVVVAAIIAVAYFNSFNVPKSASTAPITSTLKVGDTAPEFTVQTNAGPFDLAQVSTPVLVEVFATWCPHCQRETVVLNQLAAAYAGKVAIVAVSGSNVGMDGQASESLVDVNTFGQQFNVRYPIAFDPDLKVAGSYLQGGFPSLIVVDRAKKVTWITSGETPKASIEKALNAVL
jgi:thiol-disulfide isomerase/thioredoxin